MKVLIFDISNLMMRCLFAQIPSPTETKFREFKMTFLSSFMKVIKDNNPDKVIVVEDSESWRKKFIQIIKPIELQREKHQLLTSMFSFLSSLNFLKNYKNALAIFNS